MVKKIPWKTILFTLLALAFFCDIKESLTGQRTFFLYRWLFSSKKHADQVEVLAYFLNEKQVAYMLLHPEEVVVQSKDKDLSMQDLYLVLRIRDKKGGIISGKLSFTFPGMGWNQISILNKSTPENVKKYTNTIIPLGIIVAERNPEPIPITIRWDELYISPFSTEFGKGKK